MSLVGLFMKSTRINLIALLVALSANAAFADLSPPVLSTAHQAAFGVATYDGGALVADRNMAALDLWPGAANGEQALALARTHADEPVFREIRRNPSSLSLYLSVLIGVGGWHFVRSARHFNLAAAPEWYHTGGPVQVGHVTPLDLSFGTPPLCLFERPVAHQSLTYRIRLGEGPRLEPQTCLLLTAPRGPPLSA